MEKNRQKTCHEIRINVKDSLWRKVKEKIKNSRFVTVNELVRAQLADFVEKNEKNE